MMPTKFIWEPSTGGSLRLTVKSGPRTVSWDVRKNTTNEKLRGILGEIMLELTDHDLDALDAAYERSEWIGSGIYDEPPEYNDVVTEEMSMSNLAAKADSVKLKTGSWWDDVNMGELELYTLGTGDPE